MDTEKINLDALRREITIVCAPLCSSETDWRLTDVLSFPYKDPARPDSV